MATASPDLHLIVDCSLPGAASAPDQNGPEPTAGGSTGALKTVRVPGLAYLHPEAPVEELVAETPAAGSLVIEPVIDGPAPRLLVMAPRSVPAPRVNGRRAFRICLLQVGDQLLLEDGRILHLTAFRNPPVGPAPEQQAGSRCLICRTPIEVGSRAFCCPSCGSWMHCDESGETANEDRLECAKLPSICPSCRNPMNLDGGFDYVPDFG